MTRSCATRLIRMTHSSLDGYCSTVQGLLDWFEVDLGFTELSFIQIDPPRHIIRMSHSSFICDMTRSCVTCLIHVRPASFRLTRLIKHSRASRKPESPKFKVSNTPLCSTTTHAVQLPVIFVMRYANASASCAHGISALSRRYHHACVLMSKYILIHVYYLRICAHTHIVRACYFRTLWSLSSCVCFDFRISSRIYFLL